MEPQIFLKIHKKSRLPMRKSAAKKSEIELFDRSISLNGLIDGEFLADCVRLDIMSARVHGGGFMENQHHL